MKMLLTAGDFEREIRVEQADRLGQRRVDLPLPLASSASLDSVGEGNGCAVVQVRFSDFFIFYKYPDTMSLSSNQSKTRALVAPS